MFLLRNLEKYFRIILKKIHFIWSSDGYQKNADLAIMQNTFQHPLEEDRKQYE